jgi:predicted  nucleic acid-binding Zn-ribbon protein
MEINYEHRITEVEERSKSNQRRIDEVEKRQDDLDELVSTVKILALREENVENDVKEIKDDVKNLTSKPAERWDSLVDKIIWAVAGAVVAFMMAQIGF